MSSIAKEKVGNFKPISRGIHNAVCSAVIDIGLQRSPWGEKEQVWLRFEVPAERAQFMRDGLEVDEPSTILTAYSKNLHHKATLRKHLEAWRDKEFTKQELVGFDLFKLAGKPCRIVVSHTTKDDRTYANVDNILPLEKGQDTPLAELPVIRFSPDDTDQADELPDFLLQKFKERVIPPESEPEPENDFHDDDVPFDREAA